MCGITGIRAFNEKGKENLYLISAATYSLISRGPDGEGVHFNKNCALGHRRLSIIDTSDIASQPFSDETGRYTIVFNGEIFNYREIRQDLEKKGIQFRSQSDTEVLLYLFIAEKENCLQRLNGEFAFAILDNQTEELFLARDRFGIKPLYYYQDKDLLVFASEMKALQTFDIPAKIDMASLQIYLHLNYIPSPYSIYENVRKLQAGNYMKISKDGVSTIVCYYKTERNVTSASSDYQKNISTLQNLMKESVRERMVADVPLGTFLSGGIDSSVITALAAGMTTHLKTFSIGYKDEPMYDETHYANLVAKKYKTDHTAFELSNSDLFEHLYKVLDYTDEPFADSSALAVNILSRLTKKEVTVALSGDGADELFGGYNKHEAELRARNGGMAAQLVKSAYPLLKKLPKSRNSSTGNRFRQLFKFAEGMRLDNKERYWRWAGFTNETDTLLLKNALEYRTRKEDLLKNIDDDFNSVLLTDVQLVLENDMLVKTDRMSMCEGLEIRVPFLDQRIVDFAFTLPVNQKIQGNQRKRILKDAFREILPEELYSRKKQGFEVPLLKWFRTDLKSLISEDLLKDEFIREQGLFKPEKINQLKTELFSADPDDSVARIWALIVFQYWWKKHFQKQAK
ncbi:MAG: asparagine synthase (glutamine-hydrolyzing) [Bacteroidota bacterium]|nr:asparagine synthase (glutamine-hydrolyzing) [Bacteroidota bacterium]